MVFKDRCFGFLLVTFIVVVVFARRTRDAETNRASPFWWKCVRNMGLYADPQNVSEFRWKENPCGFRYLSTKDIQRQVFFNSRKNHVFFIGDSVSYRNFGFAVNSFLPFTKIDGYRRIAHVPDRIDYTVSLQEKEIDSPSLTEYTRINATASSEYATTLRNGSATYIKVRYISLSLTAVTKAIKEVNDGVIVLYLGTWDLNWRINAKERIPHLNGPIRHFPTAIRYWTRFVQELMESIQRALMQKQPHHRPLIMFLEQLPLNCGAGRFLGRINAFKKCDSFTVPVVIPLYRRVLAAAAYHLNIPVVPTSHFFKNDYTFCPMSDGVHLDDSCMPMVQQHLWNVYLLLREKRVVQGLLPGFNVAPNLQQFVDGTFYRDWVRRIDEDAERVLLQTNEVPNYLMDKGNVLAEGDFPEWTAALLSLVFIVSILCFLFHIKARGRLSSCFSSSFR